MHDSNGMMQRIARSIKPMTPMVARRLYAQWPDYKVDQKEKLVRLAVAQLNKEYSIDNVNHPVRDERKLRNFINRVASDICPGPEEYSTGHLDHQCLRCGPARRGALHEVKAAFRIQSAQITHF